MERFFRLVSRGVVMRLMVPEYLASKRSVNSRPETQMIQNPQMIKDARQKISRMNSEPNDQN